MTFIEFLEFISRIRLSMFLGTRKKIQAMFGIDEKTANEILEVIKVKEKFDIIAIFHRLYWALGDQDKHLLEELVLKNIEEDDFKILAQCVKDLKEAHEM
jgi:hypothetical protein